MLLKTVNIKNFKGIEKCSINLKPGFNLLIGDNGYGKTSVLEAVSVCLGGFIAGIEDIKTKHFTTDEIRVVLEKQGDGSFNKRYMTPVSVACTADVEGEEFKWVRRKSSLNASRSTVEPRDICKKANEMANEEGHILPILSYQSTARMWMQKREASENVFSKKFYRTVGYEGCLLEASNMKMLMKWIEYMDKQEYKKKTTIREYQGVKNTLVRFMQIMSDVEVKGLEYDDASEELVFVTQKEALPIRHLSSGYQSLIWMVLDIVYRMAILNPNLLEHINQTPGVVLIDELDMHLHPKWQWKVTEALMETFPNVQFVAATHSPMIIASRAKVNLIKLYNDDEIGYSDTPYGFDVNDTLDICQNSHSIAEPVDEKITAFEAYIDDEDLDKAEQALKELKITLGENHPKVTWAETLLRLERIPLED